MIRTNKNKETKPDFDEMMSEVKEDIQEQDAEQDIISRVPELKELSGNIDTGSEIKKVWISDSVKDIFLNEAQVPEGNDTATVEKVQLDEVNVAHTAMLLFVGYIDAATSMSESCGGGGGSSPESGWGNKNDEDERMFARRCLKMAHSMCKPKPRQRSFHR